MPSFFSIELPFAPEDILKLENINRKANLIISPYDNKILEPYTLENYLHQKHVHDLKINALFDRNIISELTHLSETNPPTTSATKEALSLLAFLQIAEVNIEPGISLAEYCATHGNPTPNKELLTFRQVDNLPTDYVINLALGREDSFDVKKTLHSNKVKPRTNYEETYLWQIHYIFSLKLYLLANSALSKFERIKNFMDWTWKEFLQSAVAFSYMAISFSGKYGKMLKGVHSANVDKRIHGVKNAAWDMTTVNYWSKAVVKRQNHEPFMIFCTADIGLQNVAKNIIGQTDHIETPNVFRKLFSPYLNNKEINELILLSEKLEAKSNDPQRNIIQAQYRPEYYNSCLKKLERDVLSIQIKN